MLKACALLLYYELLLHFRRSQDWLYPIGFFIIVLSLFPLAFTPDPLQLQKLAPGAIWLTALFASVLAINPVFLSDLEDGHLEQLARSEIPLSILLSIKLFAQWLASQLPLISLTLLMAVFFHLSFAPACLLMLTLLLGTPIITLIGALVVALTLGLRQPGVLLGLLMLPLLAPILIFGVTIVEQWQAGFTIRGPLLFLTGLSCLAITLLPWVIAICIKMHFED